MYLIYKITNLVNNKIYIGFTKQSLKRRWAKHRFESRRQIEYLSSLYSSIRKYGDGNFKIEEIDRVFSKKVSDALERETFWIKETKSHMKDIGYNMKVSNSYRESESEEFRERCSISGQGKIRRKDKTSAYLGVSYSKNIWGTHITHRKRVFTASFSTEIECAEFYDKMALFLYGKEAIINFEEKRNYYLSLDLKKETSRMFLSYREKFNNLYIGVKSRLYIRKDGSTIAVFQARVPTIGCIGTFDSELEAAETRDKIILFLNLEKIKNVKLSFPERINEFKKMNLGDVYERTINRPKKRSHRF